MSDINSHPRPEELALELEADIELALDSVITIKDYT